MRAAVLLMLALAGARSADIWARRMEIVRTPDGYATVFRDSVVLRDGDATLTARETWFYESRGYALARDSVLIRGPEAIVRADSAVYRTRTRLAELFGNVRVKKESLEISAPRLVYSTRGRVVTADSGLVLEGKEWNYRLAGRRGSYDLDGDEGMVDSLPLLSWVRGDDSMRVTGARMTWRERESRAAASGNVRVSSGNSELVCDSALFYATADSGLAWGGPRVRDRAGAANGDTMFFHVRNGALERVAVTGGAEGSYLTEGQNEVSVKGRTIRLWLSAGDIDRIEVIGMTEGQLLRNARRDQ